jgi:hypothetical protein
MDPSTRHIVPGDTGGVGSDSSLDGLSLAEIRLKVLDSFPLYRVVAAGLLLRVVVPCLGRPPRLAGELFD